MPSPKKLAGLGLSENEAKVYLAAVELGPTTAQQLARKTALSRVTTYAMIDALTARGLMSSVESEKKRFFTAESPERLKSLIKTQRAALEERERELDSFLPELKALAAGAKEKPTVRFYEGLEGLETMRQDLLRFKNIELIGFVSRDSYTREVSPQSRQVYTSKLLANRITNRYLYTASEPFVPAPEFKDISFPRRIPSDRFPFSGEVAVYNDRVAFLTYKDKPIGVMIYSKEIAQIMRMLWELAWIGSEKFKNE